MNNYMLVPRDELYHYGVKGMKWGVRRKSSSSGGSSRVKKLANKYVEKRNAKDAKNTEKIRKQIDRWGYLGAAAAAGNAKYKYRKKFATKTAVALTINAAANAYIKSNSAKYYRAKGVDYARRAAIFGLGVSTYMDAAKAYRDYGEAFVYYGKKRKVKRAKQEVARAERNIKKAERDIERSNERIKRYSKVANG